jgi:predicted DNA-binding WGR domain protein
MATKTVRLWCNKGSSDKVYEVSILASGENGYEVVARWGRRGGTQRAMVKWEGSDRNRARKVATRLVWSKLARGYVQC